jgi:hypothetical protein
MVWVQRTTQYLQQQPIPKEIRLSHPLVIPGGATFAFAIETVQSSMTNLMGASPFPPSFPSFPLGKQFLMFARAPLNTNVSALRRLDF